MMRKIDEIVQDKATCSAGAIQKGMDFGGGDLAQVSTGISTIAQCTPLCCNMAGCVGFTFAAIAPSNFGKCVKGKPCCYLKKTIGKPRAVSECDCAPIQNHPTAPPTPAPPPRRPVETSHTPLSLPVLKTALPPHESPTATRGSLTSTALPALVRTP
jgi:hypothetical protein